MAVIRMRFKTPDTGEYEAGVARWQLRKLPGVTGANAPVVGPNAIITQGVEYPVPESGADIATRPTEFGWYYHVEGTTDSGWKFHTNVYVPDDNTYDLEDLVTLDPSAPFGSARPEPMWWSVLDQLTELYAEGVVDARDRAESAADAARADALATEAGRNATFTARNEARDARDEARTAAGTAATDAAELVRTEVAGLTDDAQEAAQTAETARDTTLGYRDELGDIVDQAVADGFPLATEFSAGLMSGADKVRSNRSVTFSSEQLTVQIPTDYPDLQSAVDDLSTIQYVQGSIVTLNIEAGHRPSAGLRVYHGNYSQFRITSSDPVVSVADDFTGPFVYGENSQMPTLACLVDMRDRGEQGYAAQFNSSGFVSPGCGVLNAGTRGCHVTGSRVWAPSATFRGANDRNLHITGGSFFDGDSGNFSANKGGNYMIYVSRVSLASLHGATCTDAFYNGIGALRSKVNITDADFSRAGYDGVISSQGSQVSFSGGKANNCANRGILANQGSTIEAQGAEANESGSVGINITFGSYGNLNDVKALNATLQGLVVSSGSNVNARSMDTTGHKATWGFWCASGSTLNAQSALGVLSQTPNTITANGIIFQ